MQKKNVMLVGEVVSLFESTTGMMGTIIMQTSSTERTVIIELDGINKNAQTAPPALPTIMTHSSNKIKITKPPRFTGDKEN